MESVRQLFAAVALAADGQGRPFSLTDLSSRFRYRSSRQQPGPGVHRCCWLPPERERVLPRRPVHYLQSSRCPEPRFRPEPNRIRRYRTSHRQLRRHRRLRHHRRNMVPRPVPVQLHSHHRPVRGPLRIRRPVREPLRNHRPVPVHNHKPVRAHSMSARVRKPARVRNRWVPEHKPVPARSKRARERKPARARSRLARARSTQAREHSNPWQHAWPST